MYSVSTLLSLAASPHLATPYPSQHHPPYSAAWILNSTLYFCVTYNTITPAIWGQHNAATKSCKNVCPKGGYTTPDSYKYVVPHLISSTIFATSHSTIDTTSSRTALNVTIGHFASTSSPFDRQFAVGLPACREAVFPSSERWSDARAHNNRH